MTGKKLLTLEKVTVSLWRRTILSSIDWEIRDNQHWAILGPNGSGKTTLVKLLSGEVPYQQGSVIRYGGDDFKSGISYVSFEQQKNIIAREINNDHARCFSGRVPDILTVASLLEAACPDREKITAAMQLTGMAALESRGVRYLSNGEIRKVLLTRALLRSPRVLILDEPFDGLDREARVQFYALLESVAAQGMQFFLIVHRADEVLSFITHVLYLRQGQVFLQGEKNQVLTPGNREKLFASQPRILPLNNPPHAVNRQVTAGDTQQDSPAASVLVQMKNLNIRYGDLVVFRNFSWQMRKGENWAVTGPNGSGKSTLVSLITGDNPQAYCNDLWLFGRKRGSGESIWEIKAHLGIVSPELQILYNKNIPVRDVVLSGFFDSTGLYRRTNSRQEEVARQCMRLTGTEAMAEWNFNRLSYGERQLVLIARAVVKSPELLILDEPAQGLDDSNRKLLLDIIDSLVSALPVNLLYITHLPGDLPRCITHTLRLGKQGL